MGQRVYILFLVVLFSISVYFGSSAAVDFSNVVGISNDSDAIGADSTDDRKADITGVEGATVVELRYSDGTTASVRLAGVDPPHDRDWCQQLRFLGARQYLRGLVGESVVVETVSPDRPVGRDEPREVRLRMEKRGSSGGKIVNDVVQRGIRGEAIAEGDAVRSFGRNVSLPEPPRTQGVENVSDRVPEADPSSFEEACDDDRPDFEPEIPSADLEGLRIVKVLPDEGEIVLMNTRDRRLDYSGWRVENEEGEGYSLPRGYNLGSKRRMFVHTGGGKNGTIDLYVNRSEPLWSDTGNAALRNAEGEIVDTYEYE